MSPCREIQTCHVVNDTRARGNREFFTVQKLTADNVAGKKVVIFFSLSLSLCVSVSLSLSLCLSVNSFVMGQVAFYNKTF